MACASFDLSHTLANLTTLANSLDQYVLQISTHTYLSGLSALDTCSVRFSTDTYSCVGEGLLVPVAMCVHDHNGVNVRT